MSDHPKDSIGEDHLKQAGDQIYEALMAAHEGLSDRQSIALNARLVLLMANQIAEPDLINEILAIAGDYHD